MRVTSACRAPSASCLTMQAPPGVFGDVSHLWCTAHVEHGPVSFAAVHSQPLSPDLGRADTIFCRSS